MTSAQQRAALAVANCEIAFDNLTRQLYATDASLYRIEPLAVAFPKTTRQACALIEGALESGIPVIPRGAGTGLVGGAIGEGLVVDFSKYNRQISGLDLERGTVRVGPGVVLDNLNKFLRPHGFCFGPDVATSSRATLGGMIANDSSGAHTPVYGTTADHINELEMVLASGQAVMVGPGHDTLRKQRELVHDLIYFHSLTIAEQMPPGLLKRWPGYGISRCAREPNNLNHLISGSEGTLGAVTSAELRIVRLPNEKGLAVVFFGSIADAMQATVELLDLKPAAVEHIDRVLLDQTCGQREFQAARDLLKLDDTPCEALLVVEFFEGVRERLAEVARRDLGNRTLLLTAPRDMERVWALRKAGLALLTGCKGDAKPVTGIEDAAVRPHQLPAYVAGLEQLMQRLGLRASYYGHAAAGLLHVRPVLDLHLPEEVRKFRMIAKEVAALVKQFKGTLAGEHGVGIARTEFMHEQVGEALLGVMREIKNSFDPHNLFNPGKVVPDGRFEIDTNLRLGRPGALELPFEPILAFAAKDQSFTRNLEQCNGCGGCRKETPAMCPTFIVTGDEAMSTRGRANTIRAVLEGRAGNGKGPLNSEELNVVLGSCLSCKACVTECPSNVDLSLLKAELLHARIEQQGLSWSQRLFSHVDIFSAIGCLVPTLSNFALGSLVARSVMTKWFGLAWQRPLPPYARQRFDRWFNRSQRNTEGQRGQVLLWDDTFVRFHEPHIGVAAVQVLESAGYSVRLVKGRKCCGRPAFSQGHLERVKALGKHNLELLAQEQDSPILFLEPSCYSMFVEEYRELKLEGADEVAKRCYLFEQFIESLLSEAPEALQFEFRDSRVIIHPHCHTRALMKLDFLERLARRLPGREVTLLGTGCCGMAGAFGMMEDKYELSLKVAEPLMQQLRSQPFGTFVVASGTSCRHQISHLSPVHPRHVAELLADALAPGPGDAG